MILFIDDEPRFTQAYVNALIDKGLHVLPMSSVSEVNQWLAEADEFPDAIVLDIMFPADPGLPMSLTDGGITAGMPLFASLRSHYPHVPVVILTNSGSMAVKGFFQDQTKCFFFYKTDVLPHELATVIEGIVTDRGAELFRRLTLCKPGRDHANLFESLCVEILEYLFIPPLDRVLPQAARSDGHDIRDALLPNNALGYFWGSIRHELQAKHIVVEFKNHVSAVTKEDVIQLRHYLSRKALGRFGLLISRLPPSQSALTARADAYSEQDCLILFLHDGDLHYSFALCVSIG